MDTDIRLLIFARAPAPGRCKTRLAPLLGTAGAARFHAALVRRTVRVFARQGICQAELWCAPDTQAPLFRQLQTRYRIPLCRQDDGGLGVKMAAAAALRLKQHAGVIIIGTDCPALEPHHIERTVTDLRNGYAASIIPAEDGGYVLIGLQCFDPRVFSKIDWGTARVMAQTAARLDALGWPWKRQRPLWDIDREADYRRWLQADLPLD